MTAPTTTTKTTTMTTKAMACHVRAPEPRARFTDLLAAEWIKLWSLRSTIWAFAATLLVVLFVSLSTTYGDYLSYPTDAADRQEYFRLYGAVGDSFPRGSATFMVFGAGAIGAITMLGECTTGMIRTTFMAVPARRSVMAAKVGVVAATTTVLGLLAVGISYGAVQWILSGRGVAAGLDHPGVPRMLAASVVLAPVSALVGMGMGAILRHSAITIVTTITLLFVVPSLLDEQDHISASILHTMVLQSWQRLTFEPSGQTWPWTAAGAWTALAGWALVATLLTVFASSRRDE